MIEGDRIVFVGFPDDPACPEADDTIDATGRLVSPRLINLHCVANLDLQTLSIDGGARAGGWNRPAAAIDPSTPHLLSDADFQTSADFAVATLLKAGSTSFAGVTTSATKRWDDSVAETHALADASEHLGVRAWLAHIYEETTTYSLDDGTPQTVWSRKEAEAGLERAVEFIKYVDGRADGRLSGFLFPYRTERCSDDLLRETIRQSKLLGGVHVRSHFAQYIGEHEGHAAGSDSTLVERLDGIGFLGPDVCLTHSIYIAGHSATGAAPGDDLEILARSGTSLCHCPVVFARSGVVLESFSRYVDAGINVGLGTDCFPPDLVEEMRVAAILNKVVEAKKESGTARIVFDAATIGGANALGRPDLGRLAPGCKADVSIFKMSGLETGVVDDPIRNLVYFGRGWDCDTVLVDGRIVLRGGMLPGIDEEALLARAHELWTRYKQSIVDWDVHSRSADEMFPPVYPIVRG